jgi:hypothetical protein
MSSESIVLNSMEKVATIEDATSKAMEKSMRKFERLLVADTLTVDSANIALAYQNTAKLLTESGYYKVVGKLLGPDRQALLNITYEQYKKLYNEALRYNEVSLARLDAMKVVDLTRFNQLANNANVSITEQIIQMQFDPTMTQKDIAEAIVTQELVDKNLGNYADTWVKTKTSGFYNQANIDLGTDNGFKYFLYAGRTGGNIRPFCSKYVGQIKTLAEWNALNTDALRKGQPLPVSTYLGGYNCVHVLVAVKKPKSSTNSPLKAVA